MESVTINDIFYVLLTVALPLVLRYIYQIVSVKVADSQWTAAVNAVFAAVEYVNQTFVDSLKESGRFDKEAQEVALNKALTAAKELMATSTLNWLRAAVGDLDGWLTKQIENAVKMAKG